MKFNNIYKKIDKMIKQHQNIVIFHHINPDGDCLGSQFGLKELILKNYKNKNVFAIGDSKKIFPWMNFQHDKVPGDDMLEEALLIIVDANYQDRIVDNEIIQKKLFKNIIRIDHHPVEDDLGDNTIRWVDDSYCATGEQIVFLAKTLKWKMDQNIANYLYLSIYTDSGRFFFNKVSSRTHEITSELFKTGFDFYEMHKRMSETTLEILKFQAHVLSNFKTSKNVAYFVLTQEYIKKLNLNEMQRNRVDFLSNIKGFDIWVFFIENDDKTFRVRIRSNSKKINDVASEYNGGGHDFAAGAKINDVSEIEELIQKLKAIK